MFQMLDKPPEPRFYVPEHIAVPFKMSHPDVGASSIEIFCKQGAEKVTVS